VTTEETVPFAKRLEEAGVDLIDVSAGLYETAFTMICQPMDIPLGWQCPAAEEDQKGR